MANLTDTDNSSQYGILTYKDGDACTDSQGFEYYEEYYDYEYDNYTYDNSSYYVYNLYESMDGETQAVTKLVETIMMTYMPPILLIIGTFGNALSFYVFWQPHMRKSLASWFFRILAVVDTLCLHYGILTFYLYHMFEYHIIPLSNLGCKVEHWLKYCFSHMSAWVLVLMSVERAIGVTWPHRAKILCTKKRAIIILMAIVFTLMICNISPLFIEEYALICVNGTYTSMCLTSRKDNTAIFLEDTFQPMMDLFLMAVLPFIIMISANILIIYKAFYSQRLVKVNRSNPHLVAMTTTLLSVVFVFVLLTAPFCAYSVIRVSTLNEDSKPMKYGQVFYLVVNILRYVNNSINFFLYALSGRPFRKEIKKMVTRASVTDNKQSAKSSVAPKYHNVRKCSGTSITKISNTIM